MKTTTHNIIAISVAIVIGVIIGAAALYCKHKEETKYEAQTIECDWNVHDGYEFVADTPCKARIDIRNHLDKSIMIELLNTDGDNWDSDSVIGTLWVFGKANEPEFGLLAQAKGSRMYIHNVPDYIKLRIIELSEQDELVMQFTNDLIAESIYIQHKSKNNE